MTTTLTVAEKSDMTYSVRIGNQLIHDSIERKHLKKYLASYGVLDEKFDSLLLLLAGDGKTTVDVPLGKFEQK